jgi:predicted HicB family RNase H-like nuclease
MLGLDSTIEVFYNQFMTRRWHLAEGKVVGVRLPDSVHAIVLARAKKRNMSVSSFMRWVVEHEVLRKR